MTAIAILFNFLILKLIFLKIIITFQKVSTEVKDVK